MRERRGKEKGHQQEMDALAAQIRSGQVQGERALQVLGEQLERPETAGSPEVLEQFLLLLSPVLLALQERGEWEVVLELHGRSSRYLQEHFPEDRFDRISARYGLAGALLRAGRAEEAAEIYRELEQEMGEFISPDYGPALVCTDHLALALERSGELTAATRVRRRSWKLRQKSEGAEGVGTLWALRRLALTCQAAGERVQYVRLWQELTRRSTHAFGCDHPVTSALLAPAESTSGSGKS